MSSRLKFEPWQEKIPFELWDKFNTAYGAVVHGMVYVPGPEPSADGVTKDEALEYAADFLLAFSTWLDDKEKS